MQKPRKDLIWNSGNQEGGSKRKLSKMMKEKAFSLSALESQSKTIVKFPSLNLFLSS
jgi:hypothetical protein